MEKPSSTEESQCGGCPGAGLWHFMFLLHPSDEKFSSFHRIDEIEQVFRCTCMITLFYLEEYTYGRTSKDIITRDQKARRSRSQTTGEMVPEKAQRASHRSSHGETLGHSSKDVTTESRRFRPLPYSARPSANDRRNVLDPDSIHTPQKSPIRANNTHMLYAELLLFGSGGGDCLVLRV